MSLRSIKELLKQAIGLNVSAVGVSNFERAVRQRMKSLKITAIDAYALQLQDGEEIKELIDEVIIPETWFFRNPMSFTAIQEFAQQRARNCVKGKKLTVISMPCATGEEAYSIAMALDQVGLQPEDYHIDAFDVSARLLTKAKRGVYTRNSFRNKEENIRDIYFDLVGGTYVLHDKIRNAVNFHQGNLLDKYFGINGYMYDIVFCRNLLIYFDRETQNTAMQKLYNVMVDDGLLLLGHAETPDFLNGHLVRAEYPRAFAYRKQRAVKAPKPRTAPAGVKAAHHVPHASVKAAAPNTHAARAKTATKAVPAVELPKADPLPQTDAAVLREAARLANRGELRSAGNMCENYLREFPSSAQAYYLLGLIREAEGKQQLVADLFKKAVYLDPNHYEAMIHLALHLVRYGDADSAKKLQQRAQRVLTRKSE